jgi:arylformamidase
MRIEDYPPQEPLSKAGQDYADEVLRRGAAVSMADYFYGSDPYQGIGVHVPPKPDGTILAFVHGGGWTSGYKEHMSFIAPVLAEAGIIFATIGYRLAPLHIFPTGLHDVAAGLAWLWNNAAQLGGDRQRIFAGGHSAGGHYSALLAVTNDWQDRLGVPEALIRGCLPVSGVYDFVGGGGMSARPRFLGGRDVEKVASPIHAIKQTPPFLLAHGGEDFPHLMKQAESMEVALHQAGGDVERIVMPGRNHFTACYACGEAKGPWVRRALTWIGEH